MDLGLAKVAMVFGVCLMLGACAGEKPTAREPRYTILKGNDGPLKQSGLSADKQAEVQEVLQNREATTRKCYQDRLNELQDRNFAGSVEVLITLRPGAPASTRILNSTLKSPEVEQCLAAKIADFEFPAVEQEGEVPYTYSFRPAY